MEGTEKSGEIHIGRGFSIKSKIHICITGWLVQYNTILDKLETVPDDIMENFCTPTLCRRTI